MAKTCMTEKTANRQHWIEQGLLELMLQKRFEEITVAELCRHLELSRRSFYRYFDDLEDVLDSMLNRVYLEMVVPEAVLEAREMERSFSYWLNHRDLLEALCKSDISAKLVECVRRHADLDLMGKYMADSDKKDCIKELNLFVISGFCSLVIAWHLDGYQKTPKQMAQMAYRMLTEPILVAK